jgi:hypothetical protein
METPMATFFRNSPVLEMLDFLERLAPFSTRRTSCCAIPRRACAEPTIPIRQPRKVP